MIEEFLFNILSTSPELSEYNAGGVYPIVAPKKSAGWHLTYQQISQPEATYPDAPIETRWQINIVPPDGYSASNYRSGKTAAAAVKSILMNYRGDHASGVCVEQITFENQTDVQDSNTNSFFVAQDYIIKFYEA